VKSEKSASCTDPHHPRTIPKALSQILHGQSSIPKICSKYSENKKNYLSPVGLPYLSMAGHLSHQIALQIVPENLAVGSPLPLLFGSDVLRTGFGPRLACPGPPCNIPG
jgi:hypothetical protein